MSVEQTLEKLFKGIEEKIKGTPLQGLGRLVQAWDVLMISFNGKTVKGPHVRDPLDTKRYMTTVIYALIPCVIFGIYNAGLQSLSGKGAMPSISESFIQGLMIVVPLIAVSYTVGGIWEVLFSAVRKHEINEGFLVTGLLFPLILPPTIPLWQAAIGISFGVVIGKEVFGGTGMNILNPALVGRCFLFFAYPGNMSGDKVWTHGANIFSPDVVTSATPLAEVMNGSHGANISELLGNAGFSLQTLIIGNYPGSIAETSVVAILLGAIFLVITGVGNYRTMLAIFIGGFLTALLLNQYAAPEKSLLFSLSPVYHLLMGGFAFGAVFMATDPVSSSSTKTGKWIYGLSIGFLAVIIRVINPAYPEGMMLAILFMNLFAPLIDYFIVNAKKGRRAARAT